MQEYHVIFTNKHGKTKERDVKFSSLALCEGWLRSKGATHWEIGIKEHPGDEPDNDWRDGHPLDFGNYG